jgi:pimeloyl-ACP methyl ester carboxylesterase
VTNVLRALSAAAAVALIAGVVLVLRGAAAPADAPVRLVAALRLPVATAAGSGELALYVSGGWERPRPTVTRAIVSVHGLGRAADHSRTIAEVSRAKSGLDLESVLLVEPQFLDDADMKFHRLPAETLHWGRVQWEAGDDAEGPAPISSFAALDAILARLADHAIFPALKTVVVAGHSGGGQVVQRYAVGGRGDAVLAKAGIRVRYVVANPSSYVYFGPERPRGDGFATPDSAACPGYDRWRYGVARLPPYLAGDDPALLEAAYAARDVIYLLGTADDDPNHPELDKSCMAEAEGPTRYARGLAYYRYLKARRGAGFAHRMLQVEGVGHDDDGMFNSACGLAALYDLPGCGG